MFVRVLGTRKSYIFFQKKLSIFQIITVIKSYLNKNYNNKNRKEMKKKIKKRKKERRYCILHNFDSKMPNMKN